MKENLVSIITPVFNAEQYIEKTIESVLSQTYVDWEMLLVDDCSSDNSTNVIKRYSSIDKRIKLIELEENGGAGIARNTGIKFSEGRFIAFLDSDDLWHPKKLELQLEIMIKEKLPFTYTSYQHINENDELGRLIHSKQIVTYKNAIMSNPIGCLTVILDTEFFGKVYMPLIKKRQDLGLWLKLLKRTNAIGIKESLAYYRIRKDSISSNKLKLVKYHWYLYRKQEKLSFFKSSFYVIYYSFSKVMNVFH